MDTREKYLAAREQDIVMADPWGPSTPPLFDNLIPEIWSDQDLQDLIVPCVSPSTLTLEPFPLEDAATARNVPHDLPWPYPLGPVEDMGISTPYYSDVDIDLAVDWVDFEPPLDSIGIIPELRPFFDHDKSSPAPGVLTSPENPTASIRRTAINQSQKGILADWIARNPEPYPSREDKVILATATGLSVNQISGWFSRKRQRGLKRVQSNAPVLTPCGIPRLATMHEGCKMGAAAGMPEILHSSGLPILRGANLHPILDPHWSRCTSLPASPERPPTRISPKRARSLPHIFTLDIINPCIPTLSQLPHGRFSLDVAAPTHESCSSKGNRLGGEGQPLTRGVTQDLIYPLKPTSNSNFVKRWIEEVARHNIATPDNPLEIACCIPSGESYDINDERITRETHGPPRSFSREEPTASSQMPTGYNQDSIQAVQERTRKHKRNACEHCRRKKLRCCVYADSPEGKCASCIFLVEECVFESIPATSSTPIVLVPQLHNDARRGEQAFARDEQNAVPQSSRKQIRFDAKSSAGSSASSACSVASYMSFGSRKGRRVAFQKPSYDDSNSPLPFPSGTAWELGSSRKRKAGSPPDDGRNQSVSHMTGFDNPSGESFLESVKTVYQCTFCHQDFGTYYTWRRHEESAHVPQIIWICRPDTGLKCPVCVPPSSADTPQLPCPHRFQECWQKPDIERTFYRFDTFKQHLRTVHFKGDFKGFEEIKRNHNAMDTWTKQGRQLTHDELTCHFCGLCCGTWKERARHISQHFKSGETLSLWIPGGPYILNIDGSTPCQCSAVRRRVNQSRLKIDDKWDCRQFRTLLKHGREKWNCMLCGDQISCSCFHLGFDAPCSVARHLIDSHQVQQCSASFQTFLTAEGYIGHLVNEHSAVRGEWMRSLIIAGLGAAK